MSFAKTIRKYLFTFFSRIQTKKDVFKNSIYYPNLDYQGHLKFQIPIAWMLTISTNSQPTFRRWQISSGGCDDCKS